MPNASSFNGEMERIVARAERLNDEQSRRFGERFDAVAAACYGQLTDEQRSIVEAKMADVDQVLDPMFVADCTVVILDAWLHGRPEQLVIQTAMIAEAARRHRAAGHSRHCKGGTLYDRAYRTIHHSKKRRCTCGHGK